MAWCRVNSLSMQQRYRRICLNTSMKTQWYIAIVYAYSFHIVVTEWLHSGYIVVTPANSRMESATMSFPAEPLGSSKPPGTSPTVWGVIHERLHFPQATRHRCATSRTWLRSRAIPWLETHAPNKHSWHTETTNNCWQKHDKQVQTNKNMQV